MENKINIDLFGNSLNIKQSIDRDILTKYLYTILNSISLEDFVGLITNRFNEVMEYAELTNDNKACQKTSLLFNPHRLNTRSKSSRCSLYAALTDPKFVSGLARAILFKKDKVNELLYQALQLGINGIQYINEFPPYLTRKLCKEYNLDADSKILDPCAGWGGRMIGVSTVTNNYKCYEPSTKTFDGLIKLERFIQQMNPDFNAEIRNFPFEDSYLEEMQFDFAITSPPYYDTEIYTDEETNSLNRYKTFDIWCDCFYLPMISKTMSNLKPNRTFILNIGNRIYPLDIILLENFKTVYKIENKGNLLSGKGGLGKESGGEIFFAITKI